MKTDDSNPSADAAIPRRRLHHDVLQRLLKMLESGSFPPGAEFPTERDLIERFSVGRPAIREALVTLENLGLVKVANGKKTRVVSSSLDGLVDQAGISVSYMLRTDPAGLEHLSHARSVYESGIAFHAALSATEDEIAALSAALDRMSAAKLERHRFVEADMDFHIALTAMTRNPILISITKGLLGWLMREYEETTRAPGLEEITLQEHKDVLDAISARDPAKAALAIQRHVARADERFKNEREQE